MKFYSEIPQFFQMIVLTDVYHCVLAFRRDQESVSNAFCLEDENKMSSITFFFVFALIKISPSL